MPIGSLPIARQVSIQVDLTSSSDIDRLKLEIGLAKVEYRPEARETAVVFSVRLSFPETTYLYGGTRIRGTPSTGEALSYVVKKPQEIDAIRSNLTQETIAEFQQIKNEMMALLTYTKTVTIDLNEVMNRVMKRITPAK